MAASLPGDPDPEHDGPLEVYMSYLYELSLPHNQKSITGRKYKNILLQKRQDLTLVLIRKFR